MLAAFALAAAGCGEAPRVQAATVPAAGGERAVDFAREPGGFQTYHSKRFQLSVPLPDLRAWTIDDQSQPWLVGAHAPTKSRIELWASIEQGLMNRQRCEERARELALVPKGELVTVDDATSIGPEAYDSRVWVALGQPKKGQPLVGHVFLFGAFIRRCLVVHFSTEVPSDADEAALSARLATAKTRIVGKLALDPSRTAADVELPRDNPKRQ